MNYGVKDAITSSLVCPVFYLLAQIAILLESSAASESELIALSSIAPIEL